MNIQTSLLVAIVFSGAVVSEVFAMPPPISDPFRLVRTPPPTCTLVPVSGQNTIGNGVGNSNQACSKPGAKCVSNPFRLQPTYRYECL